MSDNKFLTSAQPKIMNPKENIKMTPGERSEGRKGLKTAVTAGIGMFPYGRALQGAGKVAGAFINTAKQYAISLFDHFGFDSVTLSPFLGFDSIKPFVDDPKKGAFILCRTSNLSASEIQDLRLESREFLY